MIPYRNVWFLTVLSVLTCGLYALYWIYRIQEDLNEINEAPSDRLPVITVFLFFFFGIVYLPYWLYDEGCALQYTSELRGTPIAFPNGGYLLLWLLGFITFGLTAFLALYIFIGHFNLISDTYDERAQPHTQSWL